MSKYSTSCSPTLGSSLGELSFVLTISINITSMSSPLVQTSYVLEDWGTNPSDSKNELSLRTFSVMNEIDGSVGTKGLTWIFYGLSFSSSSISFGLSSWESLCCLRCIVMALIKPWIWVEHCGFHLALRTVVEGMVRDRTVGLEPARMHIQQRLVRDFPCNTECRGDHCRSHVRIDMVIKNLDLEPKVDAMVRDFLDPSRWKELSKKTSSNIPLCGDGSCWKTFKPIASLIPKGKLK
uniref:Uncharacterized protein n=1 Tax=Tanacetum cinerariifolium TaxID=118510 RepID=A0A6L2KQS6_TANCI|nr:hypothetical protein [Tanacetum cinerariifolium]